MNRIKKILKKSWKSHKNTIFQKSMIFYNYGGQKYGFMPEIGFLDPGKYPETTYWFPYVIWPHLRKSKKIEFLSPKIMVKNFPESIFSADEPLSPNQYWGSIDPIGAPKPL